MTNPIIPNHFPDLSKAKAIGIDIETRDDDLLKLGPGVRRDAYIIGVGIVTSDEEFKGYYPVAHDIGPNLNKTAVYAWLNDILANPNLIKIGANLLYDFDYLTHAGIKIHPNKWYDVQIAEPLINENAKNYKLETLGQKYLNYGKKTDKLEEKCKELGLKGKVGSNIWQLPSKLVGEYCIQDCEVSIGVMRKQYPILQRENLLDVFNLEIELMPLLLRMRQNGVRIAEEKLSQAIEEFELELMSKRDELYNLTGQDVQVWSGASVKSAFDQIGLENPYKTATGKLSFTKDILESFNHPVPTLILECRQAEKFINTFLVGQMQRQMTNGRIHCQFNQLRKTSEQGSGRYGTVTGRFSSSNPNLQFIPSRNPRLGPLCRSLFIPENDCKWVKIDYSQIEFRLFAHFALGPGSDEFKAKYNADSKIDYHQWCADLAGVDRRYAKDINFGLLYGMGRKKLAKSLGIEEDEAKSFIETYSSKFPFMRNTFYKAMHRAEDVGYVKTLMGRRRRFDKYESVDYDLRGSITPKMDRSKLRQEILAINAAQGNKYSVGIQRAGTFRALNAVIQGSAADIMKKGMVDAWKAGIFNTLIPHITVHDELNVSMPSNGKEALKELLNIMETTIPLSVPVIADYDIGNSWGD